MTGVERIRETFKLLEELVPPPAGCHHVLHFGQYGSNSSDWADKLCVQVNQDGQFKCVFLDGDDLEKEPQQLVAEVVALLGATEFVQLVQTSIFDE